MDPYDGPSRSIAQHYLNDVQHSSEAALIEYDYSFKGPASNRSSTDLPWLYAFSGFLVGWLVVGIYALIAGDLDKLSMKSDLTLSDTDNLLIEDFLQTWPLVLGILTLSLLATMIFILLLRWIAKPMIWITIASIIAVLVIGIFYSYYQYQTTKNTMFGVEKNVPEYFWLTVMIILLVVLLILSLVVWAMRKRIQLAIALVKEGSRAVSAIFSTVFFPIIPWILQIVVIAFAITVGLKLASFSESGSQDVDTPIIVWFLHAINVVGFFWGISFASAFGDMVLAFTFATWYWTNPKRNLHYIVLKDGLHQTLRYHLGTLAFGSFIIAMTKIIRKVLEFIKRTLCKCDRGAMNAIMCACSCLFKYLEMFLKFLNRNAYIMCAIHGKDFWTSTKDAFNLLSRNVLRVIAVNGVTGFLFFLSKLVLASSMATIAYMCFHTETTKQLNFPVTPAILVFFGTYIIATVFFSVYRVAIDTLCLCFLEDCEQNDGSKERPYHMPNSLMKIMSNQQGVNNPC